MFHISVWGGCYIREPLWPGQVRPFLPPRSCSVYSLNLNVCGQSAKQQKWASPGLTYWGQLLGEGS